MVGYKAVLSFHVIAIISWMAGILYLYRLLVYAAETRNQHEDVAALLKIMCRRLWKAITLPAMLAAWLAGVFMIYMNQSLIHQPWFQFKFVAVILLSWSTLYAGQEVGRVQRGELRRSGKFFRVMNEVPTILMIIIVIMVIVRPQF